MGEIFKRERPRQPLEFTGERLTSEVEGQIELEHCHRYFLARELARGLDVLDVAGGEGYGSAYLSRVARSVVGVDVDATAVAHAQEQYGSDNLTFKVGSATELPLPDQSVDAVFSFETIEHFYDHDRFMEEVRRVLRPGGIFVVSTPERDIYSPANTASNPYHVRELVREEFDTLIAKHFKHSGMLLQRVILGSVLAPDRWPAALSEPFTIEKRGDDLFETSQGLPRAPYLVAVASDSPLPEIGTSFFIENGYVRDREQDLNQTRYRLAIAIAERDGARAEEAQLRDAVAMMQQVIDDRGARIGELEALLQTAEVDRVEGAAERIAGLEEALASLTTQLHLQRTAETAVRAEQQRLCGEEKRLRDAIAVTQQVVDERGVRIGELERLLQASKADYVEGAARRIAGLEEALAALTAQIHRVRATEDALRQTQAALADASRARDEMMMSTTWQVGRPVRAAARIVPSSLRRTARRTVRVLWWIVTFRFPRKMRERREALARNAAQG